MNEVNFFLNGAPSGTPTNYQEISIQANWGSGEGQDERQISTPSIEFNLEDSTFIRQWIDNGLTGGVGIFEGIPYRIEMGSETLFDGTVDLTSDAELVSCDTVVASLLKTDGADWLNEVADGFSFAYLYSTGKITKSDFVVVPYVLNYRPDALIVGQLTISVYLLTKESIEGIRAIAEATADLLDAIPSVGIGPVINVGAILAVTVKLVARIVYEIAIILALTKMIADLIDQFFPPVRRYYGMRLKRMFEVGLNHLGLSFDSTIFDDPYWSKATFLPSKSKMGGIFGAVNGVGYPNQNSAIYNFGDFLREMIKMFKADYKISNGVFKFEREDYWDSLSTYVLPDVETNQGARLSSFRYNTDEFVKNYYISFSYDIQDQNTLENFSGTNYQVISEPKTTLVPKNALGKGLVSIRPPFARGLRKNGLTESEKLLRDVAKLCDSVVNFFGGSSNLASKVTNRVGMLSLSADTTTVDKLLIIDNEQMSTTQPTAEMLWNQFHFISSFAEVVDPVTGLNVHNQSLVYNAERVPFCLEDFQKLLTNNKFTTESGETGEVISIDWSIFNDVANIQYKIKKLYTKNINLVFNEGE